MDAGTLHTWQGAGGAGGDGQVLKMTDLADWCPPQADSLTPLPVPCPVTEDISSHPFK